MGIVGRSSLVLLAALVAAPAAHAAKKCTNTSGFAAVMEAVEAAAPCASATKRGKYVKKAKKAVGSRLSGACKKEFVKRFIVQSTCGRQGFVVCCSTKKGGKASTVVKASKCSKRGGTQCPGTNPTSVLEGCEPTGACVTTTTTTTTSSSSTTAAPGATTTTSTTIPSRILDFTLTASTAVCGTAVDSSSGIVKSLTCGGLNIGGGMSLVAEGPTPDGSINRFALDCAGSSCTILPTGATPAVNSDEVDCTATGCNFGTPLPIPNAAVVGLTSCVLNTWNAPASGTIDLSTGEANIGVPLNSDVYTTGNLDQPCPRCSGSGTPDSPATGTCDRGPRAGQACTTTNPKGLTRDCPTGGADPANNKPCTEGGGNCIDGSHVGTILVDLSPLRTGVTSKTDPGGAFCTGQPAPGCFGTAACRAITENGTPAGPITADVPVDVTLASVFCIAATPSGLVNSSASLPGPGAVSLPGTFTVKEVIVTTTTAVPTTTTSVPPPTVTTTTSTTSTTKPPPLGCGNGVLDADEECDTAASSPGGALIACADPSATCDPVNCRCPEKVLDFVNAAPGNTCGTTRDGADVVLQQLQCGGLNIGGGTSITPEGPTPDGATSRYRLDCTGTACNMAPYLTQPRENSTDPDCSDTGCNFGTPLPIINTLLGAAGTTCVLNTFSAPAGGTIELTTGVASTNVVLKSDIFTADPSRPTEPCPRCSAVGTLDAPGHGTCNVGARAGLACTSTNSTGLTRDCLPGGVGPGAPCTVGGGVCADGTAHLGPIAVNLTPLTTGTASDTSTDGLFCPGQTANEAGCFGQPTCRKITENGAAAGAITLNTPKSVTLASVFCIDATGNGLIDDVAAALPGPGAVSLPGTFTLKEVDLP